MSDDPKSMAALATNLEALSLANHDFSFSLYNELAKTNTGNLFYSPFSIHVIMFMASMGATAKTFDEMITTIHLNKSTHSMEAYKNLLEELISDNDNLKLATGMFVDDTFNVKNSYVENTKTFLKSSMEKVNFKENPEKQRQYINNWVLNKTNNKISDLFPAGSLGKETVLVLANAIHFKSGWAHKFEDAADEPFYTTPSKQITVKMMTLRKDLQYYRNEELKFAALELPYEHHSFKMLILLPDAKDGLKDLENNFSKINLREISNNMSTYHVTVKLPRFKLEQSFELNEVLSNLGCPTMFTPQANFSNIADGGGLTVSKVVHKAFVDVDEKGTEAAAATGLSFVKKVILFNPRALEVTFTADHPFNFFIVTKSNNVLFTGRFSNP